MMMKILRTFIIMATLIIGVIAMSSCEDSDASNNKQTVSTNELSEQQADEKPVDSKEKKAVLDSVNKRVDGLLTKIEAQKSVIEKNQSNIDVIKKTSSISTLISWTLAVISIILSIYAIIKVKSINAQAVRDREGVEELMQSLMNMERNLASSARNKITGASTLSNRDYTDLSYRITKLERLYTQKQAHTTSKVEFGGEEKPMIPQPQPHTQHGYFGLPSQMSLTEAYFKKFDEIRDSDSRFTVEIKDEKAAFEPLLESPKLLNGIKSGDVIKFALEFKGCPLSDATQMNVKSAGEAINKDGLWIITRKALIYLAK